MSRAIRYLFLFRHAKSAWPDGVDDHERPLAPRGKKAAPKMGLMMARSQIRPDLAIVSTARRTQQTWKLLEPHLPACAKRSESRIYEAAAAQILDIIRETDDKIRALMVVGHNPGLEDTALQLLRTENDPAADKLREKFPTAALAVLALEADRWRDIAPASARLVRFVTPRSI